MIVVMAGLPASGKSTLSAALRQPLSAVLLNKDVTRACLFGEYTDYTRDQDDLCMDFIYRTTGYLLTRHPGLTIILDGRTYSRRYQVDAIRHVADSLGFPLRLIECICSEDSARRRLSADRTHPAGDRDFTMYQRSRSAAEVIPEPKLVVDTDQHDLTECTRLALDYIGSR